MVSKDIENIIVVLHYFLFKYIIVTDNCPLTMVLYMTNLLTTRSQILTSMDHYILRKKHKGNSKSYRLQFSAEIRGSGVTKVLRDLKMVK